MLRNKIIYVVFSLALSFVSQAQTNPASQKAQRLLSNVVHIKAEQDVGFGFITGEKDGKLYVVTAAHVLVDGSKMSKGPLVHFYQIQRTFPAQVVFEDQAKDLAVVEGAKPNGLTWQKNVRGRATVGDFVAFVGRDGDWYVPLSNSVGNINRIEVNTFQVDINSVVPGTSGAPLITASGIVGMILDHSGYNSQVLDLQEIKRVLRGQDLPFQLTFEKNGLLGEKLYDEDGNVYPTKIMKDGKRWMIQNLDLQVENSWCYDQDTVNCAKYGRLYTWEAAKQACAELGDGWHLPTDEEWGKMVDQYGGAKFGNASDEGKAAYEALFGTRGNDFEALLGGSRKTDGSFLALDAFGGYWSATVRDGGDAYIYDVFGGVETLYRDDIDQRQGLSVRCLQD